MSAHVDPEYDQFPKLIQPGLPIEVKGARLTFDDDLGFVVCTAGRFLQSTRDEAAVARYMND